MQLSPRLLLLPFSWLFCLIARIRNLLFDAGILPSTSGTVPLISVGNLTVGGTGKTPLTEYLIRLLSPGRKRCALLSRGYGRQTRGPVMAGENATPASIGDEPMQMKQKFPDLLVTVAEKRRAGLEKLMNLPAPPHLVLLDDAFQHRAVKPDLSILVTDYYRPVYNDLCLPVGNLREPFSGRKRADVIVVNKCPENMSESESEQIKKKLALFPHQKVFFSTINYDSPEKLTENDHETLSFRDVISHEAARIIAIAAIGNPSPFFEKVHDYKRPVKTLSFPDHYEFTKKGINKIAAALEKSGPQTIILTTEKDAVKLRNINLPPDLASKIWFIPIQLKILFHQQETFNKTIEAYVNTNQRNR
ncbi:MAG: tetraacyldisaccharide 4'-kinase [Marinilabilia sp.]